jgi:cob(I)alamin adenosyltransferase
MVRLTKIYTRGGDKGTTSLVGGQRVEKDALRLETYGTIDEVNAAVGLARTFLEQRRADQPAVVERLDGELRRIQNLLFDLGSDLATPIESRFPGQPLIEPAEVERLEQLMDELNAEMEPLDSFVLPGGGPVNGFLHQARTVCRRAERAIYRLSKQEPIGEPVLPFVNRLSDTFFVLSRWVTKRLGEPEYLWRK